MLSRLSDYVYTAETNPNPQPIAIIVLGVLLGVAVLALIAFLIAFLVSKRRQETQPNNSKQVGLQRLIAYAYSAYNIGPNNCSKLYMV